MKTIKTRQMAAFKRIAQNVNPDVVKAATILDKIIKLQNEYDVLQENIEAQNSIVRNATGYSVNEIILKKVIELKDENGLPKLDAKGNPMKMTRYDVNPDLITFNENTKEYEVKERECPVDVRDCNYCCASKETDTSTEACAPSSELV